MISVIIPLYNKEKQIARMLESVQKQNFQHFEIVIVNDGSTDHSVEEVEKIKDSRIRLVHQENAGVSAARNRGIKEAQYDLLAFLDADDEWKPDYLDCQYQLSLQYPSCDVFATKYYFQDEKNVIRKEILNKLPFSHVTGILSNYFEVASCSHSPLCSSAVMVRKKAIVDVGGFPLHIELGEDLLTWAKLACKYKIALDTRERAIYHLRSPKQEVIPKIIPPLEDKVGNELFYLTQNAGFPKSMISYLQRWHKIRMVTFVRLNMKRNALDEYRKIKSLPSPIDKKIKIWYLLNKLPYRLLHFLLIQLSNFQ